MINRGNIYFPLSSISTIADGSITSEKLANNVVDSNKLAKPLYQSIECTIENMIDISKAEDGYYYASSTGLKTSNELFSTVSHIRVIPGNTYTITGYGSNTGFLSRGCFYQSDGTYIETMPVSSGSINTITAPTNAAYCNVNFWLSAKNTVKMVSNGVLPTDKIPTLDISKADYLIDGNSNLWDDNNVISGGYYNGTGTWISNTSFVSSYLIPVTPGLAYTSNETSVLVTWWKSDETFLSSTPTPTFNSQKYVIAPDNAAYVRFIFSTSTENKQVAQGYTLPAYCVRNPGKVYFPNLVSSSTSISNWNSKKWVSYGDSMVSRNGWQPYVTSKFNLTHTNLGIGSSCIANVSGHNPMCSETRINAIKTANPDVLTIFAGSNDWVQNVSIGTDKQFELETASKDLTTYKGAYSYIIETLLSWKPTLRIFLMTSPWATLNNTDKHEPVNSTTNLYERDFAKATEEVAKYYGLPCIDIHGESGINGFSRTAYIEDNIHGTVAGWQRIAEVAIGKFKELEPMD